MTDVNYVAERLQQYQDGAITFEEYIIAFITNTSEHKTFPQRVLLEKVIELLTASNKLNFA
jgi:hypothetical protein